MTKSKRRKELPAAGRALVGTCLDYVQRSTIRITEEDYEPIRRALWRAGFKIVRRRRRRK